MKPWVHAENSAKKHGGKPEDYIEIHNFIDSSKAAVGDNRHRVATHNAWFIGNVLERIKFSNSCPPTSDNRFVTVMNSEGKHVSVRDIGEEHCVEDFKGFMPTLQDYVMSMELADWMKNGEGIPPSYNKLTIKVEDSKIELVYDDASKVLDGIHTFDGSNRNLPIYDGSKLDAEDNSKSYKAIFDAVAPIVLRPELIAQTD